MIIGINGKIGSGKDTVGKIIQWLTKPEPDGSYIGFQTYDDITLDRVSDWKIKKFAGKLKQTASLLTGIPVEKFEDQEFKKTLLGPEWGIVKDNPLNAIPVFEDVQFNHIMSVRELLQKLGTEAMRDNLHENVWVNALFADYKAVSRVPEKRMSVMPKWIITDMRFPNEMQAILEREGITIKVVRDHDVKIQHSGNPEDYTIEKFDKSNPKHIALKLAQELNMHPSETALDDAEFDYEIINDGTIEDLIEKVREILINEGII